VITGAPEQAARNGRSKRNRFIGKFRKNTVRGWLPHSGKPLLIPVGLSHPERENYIIAARSAYDAALAAP
jgi:hypothetical protein